MPSTDLTLLHDLAFTGDADEAIEVIRRAAIILGRRPDRAAWIADELDEYANAVSPDNEIEA